MFESRRTKRDGKACCFILWKFREYLDTEIYVNLKTNSLTLFISIYDILHYERSVSNFAMYLKPSPDSLFYDDRKVNDLAAHMVNSIERRLKNTEKKSTTETIELPLNIPQAPQSHRSDGTTFEIFFFFFNMYFILL